MDAQTILVSGRIQTARTFLPLRRTHVGIRLRAQWLLAVLLIVSMASGLAAQQPAADDPRIGSRILVIRAGAELRTPKETVWRAYLGEVFTVTLTNGPWLWINEKGGWLAESDTLPLQTSIDELSRRVTSRPTAENYHLRGVAMMAHDRYDEAIADFSESLRRDGRNAGALNNRGQAWYEKSDYRKAVDDFTACLKLDPKSFIARNNRALANISLGNLDAALNDLNAALQQVAEYPEALNNRGVVHQKQGRLQDAVTDFSAALKIDRKYVDAMGNRAHTFRLNRQYDLAVADLNAAIAMRPDMPEVLNDLAWIMATCPEDQFRDGARSLELAKQACELTEYSEWNILDTLGAAMAETGDFEGAGKWVAAALEKAPASEKNRLNGHLAVVTDGKPIRE